MNADTIKAIVTNENFKPALIHGVATIIGVTMTIGFGVGVKENFGKVIESASKIYEAINTK